MIVAGHDGTPTGDDAAVLAARLARATGEELVIVSVHPEPDPMGIRKVDPEWAAYLRVQAEEMSAAAQRFLSERGVAATYRVVGSSSAAHGLDDVAEELEASVIVVGSSAHGMRRLVSPGSTGERLLHGAGRPVAVAPRGLGERPADEPVERIGVAYIDAPEAREALRVARELAAETHARLTLYTVVAPRAEVFSPIAGRASEDAYHELLRESALEALDAEIATVPGAGAELLEGDVVEMLSRLDVDVLVCGSRGYGPLRRVLLGGVARRLIRCAVCPVIVVPR
jgi:nucleotide-binding universal stress UspA family protein